MLRSHHALESFKRKRLRVSRGVNDAAARVKNTLTHTHSRFNTLCVCDGGNEAHFLSAADERQRLARRRKWHSAHTDVNPGARRPPATAVGGNRSSLREEESVDGNALLILPPAFDARWHTTKEGENIAPWR